ncbi:GDSL esterase/lipase lip-4 [Phtheirospermum japonicum]|uniref:GDSL esterase/lipase lip-4 n=1 Tax=Phtheirospermum japonicum TaxID=374723 RepID=A0A830C597_9LAMI|nr:GDSL esterase/lipase lip-4 [Phtheirospermum japonicum]
MTTVETTDLLISTSAIQIQTPAAFLPDSDWSTDIPSAAHFSGDQRDGNVMDGLLSISFYKVRCRTFEFTGEYLDTHYLSPYLDSLEPDFSNGANFAVGGSCTLPRSFHFNLNVQILQFKHFYNRSVELRSKGHTDLVGEDDFKNALYTIDIGQNDLAGSFSYAQTIERIPSFISEIKDAVWFLNDGAKAFNAKLNALCEKMRPQMENSTIVYADVYSIKYDLIANSTITVSFKNPLMACCGYGGAPYNYGPDSDKTCFGSQFDVCEEGTMYISWDGVHYTEAANAIVASKIISTHHSSPPLEFNFFCNSVATF